MNDDKYEILQKEVDSIQTQMAKGTGPWYSKPSNLISVFALIFSFGTTIASAYNGYLEDIRDNRREARKLIQRTTKIPIENYELLQRYKGSGPGTALSRLMNQVNKLLAIQASELIARYPESFSSTEYFNVADALAASNIIDKVPFHYQQAIARAKFSNDYTVAARAYAGFLYAEGDLSEGEEYYNLALRV